MKKLLLLFVVVAGATQFASAQLIPSFSFGVKGGVNLSSLSFSDPDFSSGNRAGYLGGIYARVGGLGFNFQPELYITGKNVNIETEVEGVTAVNKVKFTSIDVPLLLGGKIGAFGLGGRFLTGPLVSFKINDDQSTGQALGRAVTLSDVKNQNFAWQFGAGLDIKKVSLDVRYELGLTKQGYSFEGGEGKTRINLFNVSLSYQIY
ncbi:PorT family protein [Mucilaginibacter limnophilus]|uniref:PorT family protein n=1 Tax=Mucilaginibacter limnophilus TaxID=1932778 RepID=A0A437MTH0_9SPHI|nr:porin family protein [Mucilaginibacter limnophilus]RVU00956.1 PorT family protein [Mucilaginibacter limnophilus]